MSDPFTDFMTGQLAERATRIDRCFVAFVYVALMLSLFALSAILLLT